MLVLNNRNWVNVAIFHSPHCVCCYFGVLHCFKLRRLPAANLRYPLEIPQSLGIIVNVGIVEERAVTRVPRMSRNLDEIHSEPLSQLRRHDFDRIESSRLYRPNGSCKRLRERPLRIKTDGKAFDFRHHEEEVPSCCVQLALDRMARQPTNKVPVGHAP